VGETGRLEAALQYQLLKVADVNPVFYFIVHVVTRKKMGNRPVSRFHMVCSILVGLIDLSLGRLTAGSLPDGSVRTKYDRTDFLENPWI